MPAKKFRPPGNQKKNPTKIPEISALRRAVHKIAPRGTCLRKPFISVRKRVYQKAEKIAFIIWNS